MNRLVIGLGNVSRADDGVGPAAAMRMDPRGVVATAPFQLMELWSGADHVVVIDAARSGNPAGTIYRFDARTDGLPTGVLGSSTHAFGLAEVIELARTLDQLPRQLTVYGIEVGSVSHGDALSPEVEAAIDAVVAEVDHA